MVLATEVSRGGTRPLCGAPQAPEGGQALHGRHFTPWRRARKPPGGSVNGLLESDIRDTGCFEYRCAARFMDTSPLRVHPRPCGSGLPAARLSVQKAPTNNCSPLHTGLQGISDGLCMLLTVYRMFARVSGLFSGLLHEPEVIETRQYQILDQRAKCGRLIPDLTRSEPKNPKPEGGVSAENGERRGQ